MNNDILAQIIDYDDKTWNNKQQLVLMNFHPHAKVHSPLGDFQTASAMQEIVNVWHLAFPDLKVNYLTTMANENKVVRQWTATGTHKGEFLGLEASNKIVQFQGCTIYKVLNKQVVEYWCYINMEEIFAQLL